MRQRQKNFTTVFIASAILYLVFHLLTLSVHPFVHSDEAWLASLTRAMMHERSPSAVEEMFRLTPRYPHGFKILYHLVQMPFLALSWTPAAARLPSLLAAVATLFLVWKIAGEIGFNGKIQILLPILVALDPQFVYLAHLGRQEMVLILLFTWSWYLKILGRSGWKTALPLAAAIFVHPNAFVPALAVGCLYLPDLIQRPGRFEGFRNGVLYATVLALAAAAAVGLSLILDPDFITHYRAFGDSVGAGDSLVMKFLGLPGFLVKMIVRQAGTYYLADVRPFCSAALLGYLGFGAFTLIRLIRRVRGRSVPRRDRRGASAGAELLIPTLLLGEALVGKYGPPTIGFLLVPAYVMLIANLAGLDGLFRGPKNRWRNRYMMLILFALWPGVQTVRETVSSLSAGRYRDYRQAVEEQTGPNGRVLANLNTAFAFEYDRLLIWRDLEYLPEDLPLERFLDESGVEWIILPGELEMIFESRPVWNHVYGNPAWYPQLVRILDERGSLVYRADHSDYAMRIRPFADRKNWPLEIYRLDAPELPVSK